MSDFIIAIFSWSCIFGAIYLYNKFGPVSASEAEVDTFLLEHRMSLATEENTKEIEKYFRKWLGKYKHRRNVLITFDGYEITIEVYRNKRSVGNPRFCQKLYYVFPHTI